jgi:hypothetical protein
LIIPKTYGVPVAFFAVPKEEVPAAAVAVVLPAAGVLELLELHPTAASATTLRAAALSDLTRFIWASFGDGCICG